MSYTPLGDFQAGAVIEELSASRVFAALTEPQQLAVLDSTQQEIRNLSVGS